MHARKEIWSLSPAELLNLRRAMLELQQREGSQSFIDLAGYHGIPLRLCPHGSPLFLAWHRAYIRIFEQALQAIDASVSLPFWDWMSSASFSQGMAPAHSDSQFDDAGTSRPNPLASGPIEDRSRRTRRIPPHDPARLKSFAQSVDLAMGRDSYLDFNEWLEGPHGSVHVWVGGPGGDMSTVPRAAYDPIFWSHHSTVDRQWAIWQKCNPERNPPQDLMTQPLPGFDGWTVGDTVDLMSARLDYTYEGLDAIVCPVPRRLRPDGVVPFSILEGADIVRKPRVVVEVQDVGRDGESFMVDIFVRESARPTSETLFAGSFGILGAEGLHQGHHGHDQKLVTVQRVDITDAVDRLALRNKPVDIQLQATNRFGESVDPSLLPIGGVILRSIF